MNKKMHLPGESNTSTQEREPSRIWRFVKKLFYISNFEAKKGVQNNQAKVPVITTLNYDISAQKSSDATLKKSKLSTRSSTQKLPPSLYACGARLYLGNRK